MGLSIPVALAAALFSQGLPLRWAADVQVPLPRPLPAVIAGPCPDGGRDGCAYPAPTPTVYVARTAGRATFLHEMGHTFDYTVMTDAARREFLRLTHDHRAWRSPPDSPHERFAVAYSFCARHRVIRRAPLVTLSYGYRPGPRTHRRVCRLIRQAAAGVFGRPPA